MLKILGKNSIEPRKIQLCLRYRLKRMELKAVCNTEIKSEFITHRLNDQNMNASRLENCVFDGWF
jgi:hypothetical protein